ncbi:MAG: PQQ-dependent sugar dehydrogenase, partial [Ardenticatenaceae bacterium]
LSARYSLIAVPTLISLLIILALAPIVHGQTGAGANSGGPTAAIALIAEGLASPVHLEETPDDSGRLFIVDQTGQIWILLSDGTLLSTPFLDIQDRMVPLDAGYDERGLLGLTFHPDYATNGRFFVYYSAPLRPGAPPEFDHTSHLSEFLVSAADPNVADPASESILLQVDQPQSNHNGGTVAFGPADGYLYISIGDGGGANDVGVGHVEDWYDFNEGGNGQDVTENLLGNILRLDVDGAPPYEIPPDNPFVGEDGLDEIWAYGFRNPYRFSFDMGGDNALYSQDAGQDLWEEVDIVTANGNYGWNVKEATYCFDAANPTEPPDTCPDTDPEGDPLIDPIIEFANSTSPSGGLAATVVGGYVYRGTTLPDFAGDYIFGGWSTGFDVPDGIILVAEPQPSGLWPFEELVISNTPDNRLGHYLLGFGQDSAGEVYVLTTDMAGPAGDTGRVYRLDPPTPAAATLGTLDAQNARGLLAPALLLLGLAVPVAFLARRRLRSS